MKYEQSDKQKNVNIYDTANTRLDIIFNNFKNIYFF